MKIFLILLALAAIIFKILVVKIYRCNTMVYVEYSANFNGQSFDFSKYKQLHMVALTFYTTEDIENFGLNDEQIELITNQVFIFKNLWIIKLRSGKCLCNIRQYL